MAELFDAWSIAHEGDAQLIGLTRHTPTTIPPEPMAEADLVPWDIKDLTDPERRKKFLLKTMDDDKRSRLIVEVDDMAQILPGNWVGVGSRSETGIPERWCRFAEKSGPAPARAQAIRYMERAHKTAAVYRESYNNQLQEHADVHGEPSTLSSQMGRVLRIWDRL